LREEGGGEGGIVVGVRERKKGEKEKKKGRYFGVLCGKDFFRDKREKEK